MVDLARLQAEQAQARRTNIATRLQGVLSASRTLSPSSRNAILDAIGELSPIDPAAANGLVSASIGCAQPIART